MKSFVFKCNGLPITDPLPKCCKAWYDRVFRKNKASLIIVDGFVGEGKTTLGVHLADAINKIAGFEGIVFDEQLAMGGEDFIDKFSCCVEKKLPVVVYDEAGDFNRRGSLTKFNANLNRVFQTYRSSKVVVILVLPDVSVLDSDLFKNGIVRALVHVWGRKDDFGRFKIFLGRTVYYILKQFKNPKVVVKSDIFNFYYAWTEGFFKDLTPERSRELDLYSTKNKQLLINKARVDMSGLMSYSVVADKVGRSVNWVKQKISSQGINAVKVFNRMKYFSPDVVNTLLDLIDEIHEKK
jgi:hypothetical protein